MKRWQGVMMLVVGVASASIAQQRELTAREITERLQQRYDSIQDATVKFSQFVKFGFSKLEQSSEGVLIMKRPNKFRIEMQHQTIVTNGSIVWSYSPINKQVLVDRYKENHHTLSPEQFLLNLPSRYSPTLLASEQLGTSDAYVLKLVPNDDQSFVKSMKCWVEKGTWSVRKVHVIDVNETETVYTIRESRFNTQVSEAVFTFTPPAGVEVVDLR